MPGPIIQNFLIGTIEARTGEYLVAAGLFAGNVLQMALVGGSTLQDECRDTEDRWFQRAIGQHGVITIVITGAEGLNRLPPGSSISGVERRCGWRRLGQLRLDSVKLGPAHFGVGALNSDSRMMGPQIIAYQIVSRVAGAIAWSRRAMAHP